jgi:nucleotidyltransferase substrate binding protein (TIGR01987 family)
MIILYIRRFKTTNFEEGCFVERLEIKYQSFLKALKTLQRVLWHVEDLEMGRVALCPDTDYDEEYNMRRDSAIQRFEYTIDLFWKYIKAYLEVRSVIMAVSTPADVIRSAHAARLISEDEARLILRMIKSRNQTSHMYHEELAVELIKDLAEYVKSINEITVRLAPK